MSDVSTLIVNWYSFQYALRRSSVVVVECRCCNKIKYHKEFKTFFRLSPSFESLKVFFWLEKEREKLREIFEGFVVVVVWCGGVALAFIRLCIHYRISLISLISFPVRFSFSNVLFSLPVCMCMILVRGGHSDG